MQNYKNQTDKGLKEKSRSKKNLCTRMFFLVGMLLILGTTLVLGASHIYSVPKLNGEELPTLDPLKIVKVNTSESVKRVAIFVGDGIQYKMSGQVSKDTLIEVVNSMELSKTWK